MRGFTPVHNFPDYFLASGGLETVKVHSHLSSTGAAKGLLLTALVYKRQGPTLLLQKGQPMRDFDFTPLYRASVCFDHMAALMDRLASNQTTQSSYPPYNIEKTDAETYRISLAVAGFSDQDLNVDVKENTLSITAQKPQTEAEGRYLHRGIATRSFERHFHLADHIRVNGASHTDGMLHIELKHEIPEALKPRRIEISSGDGANAPRPALN